MPTLIWLVDDDAAFCSLAKEVAERLGVSLVVMSRDAALEWRGGRLPERVIVDGELFRASKSRGLTREPTLPRYLEHAERVLVCTAYLEDDLDAERMTDPRIRLLRKPFGLDEFEAALAWLGRGNRERYAAQGNRSRTPALSARAPWSASGARAASRSE